jgi:hypothetical protein
MKIKTILSYIGLLSLTSIVAMIIVAPANTLILPSLPLIMQAGVAYYVVKFPLIIAKVSLVTAGFLLFSLLVGIFVGKYLKRIQLQQ